MATVPPAPTPWYASAIFETQITGNSNPNGDGGDPPILGSQIAYGPNGSSPNHGDNTMTTLLGADGSGTIGALTPPLVSKVTYYFWARFRNSIGYSPWSARTSYRTKGVPAAPGAPFIIPGSIKTQTSMILAMNTNDDDGGDALDTWAVGHSLNPLASVPDTVISQSFADPDFNLSGLNPGGTYYFWGRVHNVHGNSAWSVRSTLMLVAGAKVKDGLVWKRAVPYVRDAGVWKLATTWTRNAGFWNETGE